VEVRIGIIFWSDNDWKTFGNTGWDDSDYHEKAAGYGRPLSAFIVARIPRPVVPEVVAEVVKP
ncbi:hypothetical protein, partial [Streptococcus pneumoniae]|uniref:hypothetical protein n=1 Tax=Streptococcus pneumoniae TaxID=1313 RepID=UPI0018B04BA1